MKQDIKIILAIIGIVILAILFFQVKACIKERADAKVSRLEGELKAATEQADKIKVDNKIAVGKMRKEIDRQTVELAAKNETILEHIKRDEEIVPTEVIDTPGVEQNWEEIAGINATAAREWRTKYYEAQKVIAELGLPIKTGVDDEGNPTFRYPRDSVTWKLNQRYLLSEERAKKFEENWNLAENLNKISGEVIVQKDKKIARLKLGKTVTSIITYPLAIFGAVKIGQAILGKS